MADATTAPRRVARFDDEGLVTGEAVTLDVRPASALIRAGGTPNAVDGSCGTRSTWAWVPARMSPRRLDDGFRKPTSTASPPNVR